MSSPARDLADLLNGQLGLTLGLDLFAFEWGINGNSEIDAQVLIMDTGAQTTDNDLIYENPSVQVLFRGASTESGNDLYERVKPVHDYIFSLTNTDQNGSGYAMFQPTSGLTPLGRDENRRYTYTSNFYAYRTEGV